MSEEFKLVDCFIGCISEHWALSSPADIFKGGLIYSIQNSLQVYLSFKTCFWMVFKRKTMLNRLYYTSLAEHRTQPQLSFLSGFLFNKQPWVNSLVV